MPGVALSGLDIDRKKPLPHDQQGNRQPAEAADGRCRDWRCGRKRSEGPRLCAFPRTPGDAPPQQGSASLGGASAQGELRALVSALARSEATKQSMHFRFNFQTAQTVIASEAKQSIVPRKERWIASSLRSS